MSTKTIVVGTDGTEHADKAVRWAAREAERRHATLRVVHVFDWEWRTARYDYSNAYVDIAHRVAEAITGNAADHARSAASGVRIEADTLMGHAAARLLAIADTADLMVLGNRGRGGFSSLLLGSVSQRVATHAPCPVVVVRGRSQTGDGPVAAGIDDSPSADLVLGTAFEEAAGRGAALAIARSYLPPVPLWLHSSLAAVDVETPDLDAEERARVDQLLAPWRAKYPDVPVEITVSHDGAAALLVGVSHGSQLVVVGSHGRRPIPGAFLGSTSLQLLHHADCPVYIAR